MKMIIMKNVILFVQHLQMVEIAQIIMNKMYCVFVFNFMNVQRYRKINKEETVFTPDRKAHAKFKKRYELYRRLVFTVNDPDFREK